MRRHTTIGDCAPIALGRKLDRIEREKTESFIRATFDRAAKANGYPTALLRAMVTMEVEVYRVRNKVTGADEFFEAHQLPKDPNNYDLDSMELVDPNDRILTLDAETAFRYGIARALVEDINDVATFLEQRDGVELIRPFPVVETNWSEEMVRVLNHPVVSGLVLTIALIAIYVELSTPGFGLPGLVALVCLAIWGGSKYLTGLANWVELVLVVTGLVLLLLELFVIPGFGLAGITGIACLAAGLFGMLIKNPPDRLPWPEGQAGWDAFLQGALGLLIGIGGFIFFAIIAAKYLPRWRLLGGLVLTPAGMLERPSPEMDLRPDLPRIGDIGVVDSPLRPAGKARFGRALVDCLTYGQFLEKGRKVRVTEVTGNKVVVEPIGEEDGRRDA
jgi:membrane-bound serine protease (ClpP class)